jgi:hypothetical protein
VRLNTNTDIPQYTYLKDRNNTFTTPTGDPLLCLNSNGCHLYTRKAIPLLQNYLQVGKANPTTTLRLCPHDGFHDKPEQLPTRRPRRNRTSSASDFFKLGASPNEKKCAYFDSGRCLNAAFGKTCPLPHPSDPSKIICMLPRKANTSASTGPAASTPTPSPARALAPLHPSRCTNTDPILEEEEDYDNMKLCALMPALRVSPPDKYKTPHLPHFPSHFDSTLGFPGEGPTTKIVSYNINGAKDKLAAVLAAANGEGIDALLLQEIHFYSDSWDRNRIGLHSTCIGLGWIPFVSHASHQDLRGGTAILVRRSSKNITVKQNSHSTFRHELDGRLTAVEVTIQGHSTWLTSLYLNARPD